MFFIAFHIMQLFQYLITPSILAPLFFATTLVASLATPDPISRKPYTNNLNSINKDSTPDCAASPKVLADLPYEFWIEAVFLEPPIVIENSPIVYRPGNPLHVLSGINSPSGAYYDGVFIAETSVLPGGTFDVRSLFKLGQNFLWDSSTIARLWLGTNDDTPDADYLSFEYVGDPQELPDFLAFRAVKVCNSKNETELQLRAQISEDFPGEGVFFFFGLPPPPPLGNYYCRKTERTWKGPSTENRKQNNGDSGGWRMVALLMYFLEGFEFSNSPADDIQFQADILGKIFTPAQLNGT